MQHNKKPRVVAFEFPSPQLAVCQVRRKRQLVAFALPKKWQVPARFS